jgi:hypothetical protein
MHATHRGSRSAAARCLTRSASSGSPAPAPRASAYAHARPTATSPRSARPSSCSPACARSSARRRSGSRASTPSTACPTSPFEPPPFPLPLVVRLRCTCECSRVALASPRLTLLVATSGLRFQDSDIPLRIRLHSIAFRQPTDPQLTGSCIIVHVCTRPTPLSLFVRT